MFKRLKRIFKPDIYPSDNEIYIVKFFEEYNLSYELVQGNNILIYYDEEYFIDTNWTLKEIDRILKKDFPMEFRNEQLKKLMK